jgi:dihydrofolate reductase
MKGGMQNVERPQLADSTNDHHDRGGDNMSRALAEQAGTTEKQARPATIVAGMSMSVDGFVAGPGDEVDRLFAWYALLSEASGALLQDVGTKLRAIVNGRRTFDIAEGWGGQHPLGVPVFVVTHNAPDGWDDAPFTFVTDGVESAVAQAAAIAGDGIVGVSGADVVQQCLNAELLDEIAIDLVPVLLGEGIRFFDNLKGTPTELEGPRVTEGNGVTHLSYRVKSSRG